MTVVLKLGGSVVTEKDVPETVDEEALGRAADAIAGALAGGTVDPGGLVVVHGGGSFGHHHADRHGVTDTAGTRDAQALADIHAAMGELNAAVVDALHERGVDALPVRPLSLAHHGATDAETGRADESGSLHLPTGSVPVMLDEGFVPVLHGDVVVHEGRGGTILSGDEIVASLARSLAADRVGLCSTVPGVLDADGNVIRRVDALSDVAALGDSDATDVTGGMAGKVRTLLALPAPAHVFGLADLPAFLAGDATGTVVGGDS
ncbi:acetylglutamate kinase [Halobacteriales archaeon SW_10_68_16]|jgi:isopentenyl phosphate kinase|nr:MAG: acetylglutamate kinase [Halobacteriales archaeon SW_10_68_16]